MGFPENGVGSAIETEVIARSSSGSTGHKLRTAIVPSH
jgi:hypothetical protein